MSAARTSPGTALRLEALARLAAILRDRDLARLAAASRAVADTTGRIDALAVEVVVRSGELVQLDHLVGADPAFRAGADGLWLRGLHRRRAELQSVLLRHLTERAEALGQARRALGRAEVLGRLAERARRG